MKKKLIGFSLAPPLYQNSIHVWRVQRAYLSNAMMFEESPGLFVVRRPSANSRWGGVQLIYYMLLERDMSDPSLLLSSTPPHSIDSLSSVLQLLTPHFSTTFEPWRTSLICRELQHSLQSKDTYSLCFQSFSYLFTLCLRYIMSIEVQCRADSSHHPSWWDWIVNWITIGGQLIW